MNSDKEGVVDIEWHCRGVSQANVGFKIHTNNLLRDISFPVVACCLGGVL